MKVEPALIDMNSRLCSNEISSETNRHTSEMLNTDPSLSSSNNILQQPMYVIDVSRKIFVIISFRSPTYCVLRRRTSM